MPMNDDLLPPGFPTGRWSYPDSEIPPWCGMHPSDHHDGLGGCWGISHGLVRERGEGYCKNCESHRDAPQEV